MVSGKLDSRAKYPIVCGRPSSDKVKSCLLRSFTILPFWSRTVANTLTTRTLLENVGSVLAAATFGAVVLGLGSTGGGAGFSLAGDGVRGPSVVSCARTAGAAIHTDSAVRSKARRETEESTLRETQFSRASLRFEVSAPNGERVAKYLN
jgi:hypothetical protein